MTLHTDVVLHRGEAQEQLPQDMREEGKDPSVDNFGMMTFRKIPHTKICPRQIKEGHI